MKRSERVLITVFLLLCMFFLSAVFAVQGSLLSTMIDNYQLNATSQGTANTMAFAGGIIALISAFALQGRWKKRTLVKASVMICVAGLVLMWLAPTYGLFVAAWFITGFGLGLMDTLLSACMADLYTSKQAVLMMCILHTAYGLSSVFSPMGYSCLLASGAPWKRIYLVIAVVGLMIVLGALLVRRLNHIVDNEELSQQTLRLTGIVPALHQGRLLWLVFAIFFHGIFLSGLNTWVNRYADTLGDAITIPAQSCVFLGVMFSRFSMPFLPIKTERYVIAGGLLGGIALCVGLLFSNGWILRLMLILSSLLFGALIPCIITMACQRQPANTMLATTAIMLMLYLGQAVSSPMIALLESAFGLQSGMFLCAACMLICSGCCICDRLTEKGCR